MQEIRLALAGADHALFHNLFEALRSGNMSKVITLRDGIRMLLPGVFAAESAEKGGKILNIHRIRIE